MTQDANQNGSNAGNAASGDALGGNKGAGNETDNATTDPGTNNGTNANTGNAGNAGNDTPVNDTGNQPVAVVPDGTEGSTTKFKIQNPGTQPVQVVITASGESWVEVRKGSKSGEKLYFGKTKDGDVLTYDVVPEGLYILSGNSAKTAITVAEQPIEDGKTTSRFFLSLDDGTGGGTPGNTGTEGSDAGNTDRGNNETTTTTE